MDGVIIDSEPLHLEIEKELLEELGGKFSEVQHDGFVGTTDEHMWETLKNKFDLEPSVEEMIEMKKERFIKNIHRIPLIDNFDTFISSLYNRGYLIGLASSNNRKAVDSIIEKFDLNKYLRVSVSGDDVIKGKPNPEIFLKAAKKMNVNPSECLVMEDAANGVRAAKAANMICIGFKNPNSGNQDLSKADLIVESYNELNPDIMKNLFS